MGEGDKTVQTTLNSALVNFRTFILADNAIFGGVEVGLISEVKIRTCRSKKGGAFLGEYGTCICSCTTLFI